MRARRWTYSGYNIIPVTYFRHTYTLHCTHSKKKREREAERERERERDRERDIKLTDFHCR